MFASEILKEIEPLLIPGMGTENVAGLLYSLVRMTRPRTVLEVGLGYTTPFLLKALEDNLIEVENDLALLQKNADLAKSGKRRGILLKEYYQNKYQPKLIAIDNHSLKNSSAPKVLETIKRLSLDKYLSFQKSDFENFSSKIDKASLPIDFVWFDCGGPQEYINFFREYWPHVNPEHGIVVLHYTYWRINKSSHGPNGETITKEGWSTSSILNELKAQQAALGANATFEVLSLLEPHKHRQGSVTMLRRLPPQSKCRAANLLDELTSLTGRKFYGGFNLD